MSTANRLAREKSPYLLQHAHNPVDWYPWGEEAFDRARQADLPIFLSIGYSTCHWCHVMERESFENPEIAALLNRHFVSIKVDREERPDVDRVYMAAVQAMTGAGGWPLSAWLTHDLRPFYTGTYFPPDSRYGRPGFPQVLLQLSESWRHQRDRVEAAATQVGEAIIQITRSVAARTDGAPEKGTRSRREEVLRRSAASALQQLSATFDREQGGFSDAPKFPRPTVLGFLLAHHHRTGSVAARDMALHTLRSMWRGGINDHLGGGFHRYSVDRYWRVPHFEKMLYDQAQLVWSYVDAYRLGRDDFHAGAARQILDYVARELTDPEGGFFSAEDADSAADPNRPDEKEEGAFYLWERAELETLLGDDADVAIARWGVSEAGNTISDPQQEFGTRNVLYVARDLESIAAERSLEPADAAAVVERSRRRLLEARAERPRPHLDDKVITAWNGLMISAFARAAEALGDAGLLEIAERAADFVLERCRDRDGELTRRYREGEPGGPGQLEDHAAMALALVDLYQSGSDERRLVQAERLVDTMIEDYHDAEGGAFFDSRAGDPHLLVRTKEAYDGAEPSGNSMAARVLWELSQLLAREDLERLALDVLDHFQPILERAPHAVPYLLEVAEMTLTIPEQVVIVGDPKDERTDELIGIVRAAPYHPSRRLIVLPESDGLLRERSELMASLAQQDDVPTAYLCRDLTCELPITEPGVLAKRLAASSLPTAAARSAPGTPPAE